jgi:hypothetical protein
MLSSVKTKVVVESALERYRGEVEGALSALAALAAAGQGTGGFVPGYELPPPSPQLARYLSASTLDLSDLGDYRGHRLTLLNLMRNPRTRTTKTLPSLVIVARAAEHIRRTGERVMIVSPSSGNKATALRDAVLRAYEAGLVTPEQLQILVVVPETSRAKLWDSPLSTDPELRRRNPVATHAGAQAADVKPLAMALVDGYAETLWRRHGVRLWYTLDIENYKAADVVRACVEQEHLPTPASRLHVHAVSSAYGLLGHDLGARRLAAAGGPEPSASYLLVQHLGTPDMVLSLHFGGTSRDLLPAYDHDAVTGLYVQHRDPRFPATTFDPHEVLDPTFYTSQPPTSAAMNPLIRRQGGGGIVVSLHECLERYPRLRALLAPAGVNLPADPRDLREWSLVMALTGLFNGIDRGLVDQDDIVVHGSGSYQAEDYTPIPAGHLTPAASVGELAAAADHALEAGR